MLAMELPLIVSQSGCAHSARVCASCSLRESAFHAAMSWSLGMADGLTLAGILSMQVIIAKDADDCEGKQDREIGP